MKKQQNQNTHCLRSKKLNEDQILLLRQFGGQQKNNKMEYKLLEESINNLKKENRITKMKVKYSPPSIKKNSRSNHKKINSNNKKKNSKILKKIRQNSDRSIKERNRKEKNSFTKNENQKNSGKKNNDNKKSNEQKDNDDYVENKQSIISNKKVGVKTLIYNYKIININEDNKINEENNPQNPNLTIDIPNSLINQSNQFPNIPNTQKFPLNPPNYFLNSPSINNINNINNSIITTNITNINRISNYYPSTIYTPRIELKEPLMTNNFPFNNKPIYGKMVNNKRTIFGLCKRPKEDLHKILKKKRRRRRRLKNVLNYKKYQEKLKEMPNYVNNNNEFKYIFETSHRIAKNYWHVKVDIVNTKKYLDYFSDSDESYGKIRVGKRRGRKRKRFNYGNDEMNEMKLAEINAISELKKNLEKTDGDVELLFNRDSIEKSSGEQSFMRDNFDD